MKKIYYLGIPGSNSYAAARQYFGTDHDLMGKQTFLDIFTAVTEDASAFGIIPIENTLGGSVVENYDLLDRFDVWISGEYYLTFENHLLAWPLNKPNDQRLQDIKTVYSHPQPLLQCSHFFETHPWMKKKPYFDTARAAQYVSEAKNPSYAAIANRDAAQLFGLDIIQENISDNPDTNYTRFFIITGKKRDKEKDIPQDAHKASVTFTLPHVPGSLVQVLQVFSEHHFNLVKIESRPIPAKPFEYRFHVDIAWEKEQQDMVKNVMHACKQKTHTYNILGFYKAASLPV